MSKWTWIEALDRTATEELLRVTAEQSDSLRLRLLDDQEKYKQLQFHLNRLRREAGEIP